MVLYAIQTTTLYFVVEEHMECETYERNALRKNSVVHDISWDLRLWTYASLNDAIYTTLNFETSLIARFMGSTWGHLGPTGPRWAPFWPHELCYLGLVKSFHCCSGMCVDECGNVMGGLLSLLADITPLYHESDISWCKWYVTMDYLKNASTSCK